MWRAHTSRFGYLALLAPILAACTVTIILIFRDQTLIGEIQASTFKSAVGPSLAWFDEHIRYERLFMASPDGSVARRFAVLDSAAGAGRLGGDVVAQGPNSRHRAGPSRRIIGITIISFLVMMFTPTKWTHHFGVFAGLAGSLGALAAVAVTAAAMTSRRNRTMFAAAVLFMTALVVRQRQRLVVRLELRRAVVESVPGVAVRLHHHSCSACRSWPCWWRRGSTSPAATQSPPSSRAAGSGSCRRR